MPLIGKSVVVHLSAVPIATLEGYNLNILDNIITLDPDISNAGWNVKAHGLKDANFVANYNFATADHVAIFALIIASADVACVFYPEGTGSNKDLVGGSFGLQDMGHSQTLLGTIKGTISGTSNGAVTTEQVA